jgi:prophage DNA circulation protein
MSIRDFGERWRQNLQPASFRGCGFKVDTGSFASGQRLVPYEFPKQDQGYVETMGKRLRHFRVTGYIIQSSLKADSLSGTGGPDYQMVRDMLINALEGDTSALLVHPTLGQWTVFIDHYQVSERKEKGGIAIFEIDAIEAGVQAVPTPNPTAKVATAAQSALAALPQTSTMQAGSIATPPATKTVGITGLRAAAGLSSPYGGL